MTLIERLMDHVGPEEPHLPLKMYFPSEKREASAAERAAVIAGRATWLAGRNCDPYAFAVDSNVQLAYEAGYVSETHDCYDVCQAMHKE